MQSGRRHACAVCRKAKAADEFPIGTSKSSLKGEWVCTECGGVSPSRIPTPALGARPMSAAATTFVAAAAPAESFTPPVSRVVAPAPSAAAPAKLGSLKTATIAQVVTAWVTAANEFVKSKISATPWPGAAGNPQLPAVQIPYIDRLLKHAASLDPKDPDVVHRLYMIISLMGRAGSYNIAIPDPTKGLKFPLDHHFHPSWPQEWYYVCTKIPIKDSKGNVGEIAFLASIIRQRSVGLDQQQAAGWSDFQTTTMNYVSSATIRLYDPKDSTKCVRSIFARATPNAFWGVLDKPDDQYSMFYSKPGEVFGIGCGTTSIISTQPANSPEILPAKLTVDDKAPSGNSNIKISCTLAAAPGVSKSQGWFYQGVPQPNPKNPTDLNGCPGTGFSLTPTPGIYYSWPQVVVANASVNVNGEDFIVTGNGNGWIDHEVITASLFNYDPATNTFPVEPIPFREDASPMQGWTWQFCNMANGKEAWTGSTFVFGNASMSSLSPSPTGYYVTLGSDGIYKGAFASGATLQTPNMTVTSPSGMSSTTPLPFVSVYQVANDRTYLEGYGSWLPFTATGSGWTDPKNNPIPAIFNTNDFGTICEVPAQFVNAVTKSPVGWGYLESQGFEGQFPFMNRLLYYLESKNYPVSPLVEIVTA